MDTKELLDRYAKGERDFREAYLQGANLLWACLQGANLQGANLQQVNLRWANLQGANLRGADLRGADLRWANLRGANLQGANLRAAVGNMLQVKSMQIETYPITYTKDVLQIGCERRTFEEWLNFSYDEINYMDHGALEFWHKWKDTIFKIIEMSPAED